MPVDIEQVSYIKQVGTGYRLVIPPVFREPLGVAPKSPVLIELIRGGDPEQLSLLITPMPEPQEKQGRAK